MKRRDFLHHSTLGAAGIAFTGAASAAEPEPLKPAHVQYRELGRTGLKVSAVSFGAKQVDHPSLLMAAFDAGINYFKDSSSFIMSLCIKNAGAEITTYNGTRFGTPLDVQVGISKKLKHLPLRVSVTGHQLHRLNARYDDPNKQQQTDIFGEEVKVNKFSQSVDNIFRHLIFSGEFMLGKNQNLRLRASYNHLRRKELSLSTFRSMAGFGLGFGIKVNAFKLDYGLGYHHIAGATNHISISTDLGKFIKF